MRQIVLDTETTGLDPRSGHRLVEIGCLELNHYLPSGITYHTYLNPERSVPEEAQRVHGLSTDFLKDFPVFKEISKDFLDFIGDTPLIIHNARFDMGFLNAELNSIGCLPLSMDRVTDTLTMARGKFPGAPASLDALCKRFSIDNSNRTFHGALLDAELLAEVYLQLMGGRQPGFSLSVEPASLQSISTPVDSVSSLASSGASSLGGVGTVRPPRRLVTLTPQEIQDHEKLKQDLQRIQNR